MKKNSLIIVIFFCGLIVLFLLDILFFLFFPKIVLARGEECRCVGETTGRRTVSLGACCWGCYQITGSYQNVFWAGTEKPCDCLLAAEMGVGGMEGAVEGTAVTTNPEFLSSLNKCCESFGGKPVIWHGERKFCACKCPSTNEYQSAEILGDCCDACGVGEGGSVLWNTDFFNPSHSSTTCEANCECADGSKKISGQPSECCIACSSYEEVKYEGSNFDCACQAGGRVFLGVTEPDECCRTAARELRISINDLEVKIMGVDIPCGPHMLTPPEQPAETPPFEQAVPRLEIPLPTLPNLSEFMPAEFVGEAPERYLVIPWIGQYIAAIYKYIIGITGILAGIMIVIAGAIWLTAGGSAERVSTAKNFIEGAMVGLVIALTSYLLLYAINPNLTEFEALKIKFIERMESATVSPPSGYTGSSSGCRPIPVPDMFKKPRKTLTLDPNKIGRNCSHTGPLTHPFPPELVNAALYAQAQTGIPAGFLLAQASHEQGRTLDRAGGDIKKIDMLWGRKCPRDRPPIPDYWVYTGTVSGTDCAQWASNPCTTLGVGGTPDVLAEAQRRCEAVNCLWASTREWCTDATHPDKPYMCTKSCFERITPANVETATPEEIQNFVNERVLEQARFYLARIGGCKGPCGGSLEEFMGSVTGFAARMSCGLLGGIHNSRWDNCLYKIIYNNCLEDESNTDMINFLEKVSKGCSEGKDTTTTPVSELGDLYTEGFTP